MTGVLPTFGAGFSSLLSPTAGGLSTPPQSDSLSPELLLAAGAVCLFSVCRSELVTLQRSVSSAGCANAEVDEMAAVMAAAHRMPW
jgi:hypothetical protein